MGTIRLSDLVQCISRHLMRELYELSKTEKRNAVVEYCGRTRSLLKRVKKLVSWVRVYSQCTDKEKELNVYVDSRLAAQKDISNLLFSLHAQQKFSLRTPPFALDEAADVLCRGEYCNFPVLGFSKKPEKVPLSKFTRILKYKALLMENPIGAQIK